MKKTTILFFIVCCNVCTFGQINTPDKWNGYFKYNNTVILFSNSFIIDSARKYNPVYIHFPFTKENFVITGPDLKISISETKTGILETNKKGQIHGLVDVHGSISALFIDSAKADSNLFNLQNLQIKVTGNNKIINDWSDVDNYPMFSDTLLLKNDSGRIKKNYWIFNNTVEINENLLIEIRNKNNLQQLSSYSFKRIALPVTPFLAMMWHDSSSSQSAASFIQKALETKEKEMGKINSFYADWPPNYGAGNNNEKYFPSSKLAFYFRKPDAGFRDSSLEYKLSAQDDTTGVWHKSGHLILFPKLESNTHYLLQVRYIDYPENVWKKTFYVLPQWYQTNTYKFIGTLIIILLFSLLVFFIYRKKLKKEKERKAKLNLQLKSIRSQLNPHFVFNALSSIQGLINTNEISKANQYLSEFSNLLRESLKSSENDFIPLTNEIQIIESYLKLEQLRFEFQYNITVDSAINSSETKIPSLLIQPVIENAVKHGVAGMREKGEIEIKFYREKEFMLIEIKDNGKGFDMSKSNNGFGLKLTRERILLLNQTNKDLLITMNIKSENVKGTNILLSLKSHF
jgi:cbb3-type cytochrome oxidase subunit 3